MPGPNEWLGDLVLTYKKREFRLVRQDDGDLALLLSDKLVKGVGSPGLAVLKCLALQAYGHCLENEQVLGKEALMECAKLTKHEADPYKDSIYTTVSRLRKALTRALGEGGATEALIERTQYGYRLAIAVQRADQSFFDS